MKMIKTMAVRLAVIVAAIGYVTVFFDFGSQAQAQSHGAWVRENHLAEDASVPKLLSLTNSAGYSVVFGTNEARTDSRVLLRTIQNTGTNPIFYVIGAPSVPLALRTNINATNYHGIIAGGLAWRDGMGSVADFSRVPWPIYIRSATNTTEASVVELTQ